MRAFHRGVILRRLSISCGCCRELTSLALVLLQSLCLERETLQQQHCNKAKVEVAATPILNSLRLDAMQHSILIQWLNSRSISRAAAVQIRAMHETEFSC